MLFFSGCFLWWDRGEYIPPVVKQSPFQYRAENMQEAKIFVEQRTLNEAQKLAIISAKKSLLNRIMNKIDSICLDYDIYYQDIVSMIKKDIKNAFEKHTTLVDTVVKQEGYLFVLVSTDFNVIKQTLQIKIQEYLKKYPNKWLKFKQNYDLQLFNEQINYAFRVRG